MPVFRLLNFVFCMVIIGPTSLFASQGHLGFEQVIDEARQLAGKNFQELPDNKIPDFLKDIPYDQWRDIRFKNTKTLWQNENENFKIRFFHLGLYYHQPVTINDVDSTGIHQFQFSPDLFDYGKNDFQGKIPPDLGFAGFRIHYPINTASYADEIAVFLGATYFRAVAKGQFYGASARGLAINTASDMGEEFPFFKEFWIIKPLKEDKEITVYALMDSPSIAGAYQFIIHPGEKTVMQVNSVLFTRKRIEKLGIAPLTSMFFYGENSKTADYVDFRPEVHDSDGILIFTKWGEWIWRPLVNPKDLLINTFEVQTPQGFGLFQRDMNFDHYQDLESRYENRPSLWIVPKGDWGNGHVELVQIPSNSEHNDNINVFWVPQKSPEAGKELNFSYTLEWCSAKSKESAIGFVTDTRVVPQGQGAEFVIDFQGLAGLTSGQNLTADIDITKDCRVVKQQVLKNAVTGGWRLVFQIQEQGMLRDMVPGKKPVVGLRAFLKDGSRVLTETWDYAFTP